MILILLAILAFILTSILYYFTNVKTFWLPFFLILFISTFVTHHVFEVSNAELVAIGE